VSWRFALSAFVLGFRAWRFAVWRFALSAFVLGFRAWNPVLVRSRSLDDFCKVSGEPLVLGRARQNVGTRGAGFEDVSR